ncbi:MAG: Gfo/Idh/MocA family protein [Christensenellales bacterium]
MADLKVGIIGTGAIGREHALRLNDTVGGAVVTVVYDFLRPAAESVAELVGARVADDPRSLVFSDDVDAVVVTNRSEDHAESVLLAIEAGKPVFCEKPLATLAADCEKIMQAEMKFGKKLVQVGFMRRYDKGYRQLKSMLDSQEYGEPLMLHCAHRNIDPVVQYNDTMTITQTAIHEIDCLHWLVDDEYVSGQVLIPRTTKYAQKDFHDPQIILLRTKKGICIDIEVFMHARYGYDIQCEVCCEEGVILMAEPSYPLVRMDAKRSIQLETDWKERFIEAYDVEFKEWVEGTLRGEVTGPTSWDGYVAAVTADALVEAQKTGAIVSIEAGECPAFYK